MNSRVPYLGRLGGPVLVAWHGSLCWQRCAQGFGRLNRDNKLRRREVVLDIHCVV